MRKNKNENNKKEEYSKQEIEDTTKYGEFISSYFAWLTLDKQKENAKAMEEMTKNSH